MYSATIQYAAVAWAWIRVHPQAVLLLLTLLVAVFKPKTPEQYAAMNPRVAAFWKTLATVLPDIVKAYPSVLQVISGKPDPSKVPVESVPPTLPSAELPKPSPPA